MSSIANQQLEIAISNALKNAATSNEKQKTIDAATVARVVTRWHGDDAVSVLLQALELCKAGVP